MAGYILRGGQQNISLPADALDKLLQSGQGDAALLYLALQRFGRGVTPEELEKALPISRLRIDAAEQVLQQLGLLPRPAAAAVPAPAEDAVEIAPVQVLLVEHRPLIGQGHRLRREALLQDNEGFRLLLPQVEQQLGKKLRTADLQILAGLYDDLGLPADVIYLLVCHCVERAKRRWGEGRRPTLRQIEKEGYYWAQLGIYDQTTAAAYLKKWAQREEKSAAYMQALHLPQRQMVEAERRYIADWMEQGFPPETVALAYERTVFYKKDLNWRYLNGILRRWHENGWHTPQQVQRGEEKNPASQPSKPASGGEKDAWMRRYIKR